MRRIILSAAVGFLPNSKLVCIAGMCTASVSAILQRELSPYGLVSLNFLHTYTQWCITVGFLAALVVAGELGDYSTAFGWWLVVLVVGLCAATFNAIQEGRKLFGIIAFVLPEQL